tara:strand:- start:1459 stop:1677 length:219 start_codon:yes stop_codon:yes gene_type:complete
MDEVWKREQVESPCVKLCIIHSDSGFCMGCYRTSDEIAAWSRMSADERRERMLILPERAPMVKGARRGGRRR